MEYDFFNGDADGMISLHQYRMFTPKNTIKHTGIKRDIDLLRYAVTLKKSRLNVFDLSLKANEQYVRRAIANDNDLVWFDHHTPGELESHDRISCHIDTNPNTCTSWIVDKHLDGLYRPWTVAAAYGDNLHQLAVDINPNFAATELQTLQTLGETLNYSGYGNSEADLVSHPLETFRDMCKYMNPFDYVRRSTLFGTIKAQYDKDQIELNNADVVLDDSCGSIVLLPDSKASVRFSGMYSNKMATDSPNKAFVILTRKDDGYKASIRAPLNNPYGANKMADQFETGGGREKAAGINYLPANQLVKLKNIFVTTFS